MPGDLERQAPQRHAHEPGVVLGVVELGVE
jgi:hypothetical protein